jgi:hypothetical protein
MGGKNNQFLGTSLPTPAMKQSLAELCNFFTKAPVLAHFNTAKPVCLKTNASRFATAGIVLQQQDEVSGDAEGTVH